MLTVDVKQQCNNFALQWVTYIHIYIKLLFFEFEWTQRLIPEGLSFHESPGILLYEQQKQTHTKEIYNITNVLGPVVRSIVSLTNPLRGQLVKCFMTLLPNTLIFFVEKMREAFALQKLLTFFQQKILANLRY